MTVNAIESALWTLVRERASANVFAADPEEFLRPYRLTDKEREDIRAFTSRALVEQGASALLILQAWSAARGLDQVGEYLSRMNTPSA